MRSLILPAKVEREELLQTPLETLVEIILRQQEILEKQAEEIERLKSKSESDSSNSSKPPSSDLLKRSEKKPSAETEEGREKRKPGGQTGHEGKTRKGFGRVDRVVAVRPSDCPNCGGTTFEETPVKVRRYQVAELVERPLEVVEYERQCCQCQSCGEAVWGTLPFEVIGEQSLGAKRQSLLVWLGNYGHLSYEKQQELLGELGGVEVGTGTLMATNARVSSVLKVAVEKLGEWVQGCPHVQVDETPWLVRGVKEWMWVACGVGFCLFHAGDTRSRSELEILLGKSFQGVLSSDDFSVYNGYPALTPQKCLAHLRRHLKKVSQLKHGNNPQLGQVFLDRLDTAFTAHRQWRSTGDTSAYHEWADGFKREVRTALDLWLPEAGYAAG